MSGCATQRAGQTQADQRPLAPVEDRSAGDSRTAAQSGARPRKGTGKAPREAAESGAVVHVAPGYVPPPARRIGRNAAETRSSGFLQGKASSERFRSSPAVMALLARAKDAKQANKPDLAASALERALRIEPTDPRVWHELALVRLRQGQYLQAEAVALKSNSLAAQWPAVWPENWQLIASARRKMGDEEGVNEALRMRDSGRR